MRTTDRRVTNFFNKHIFLPIRQAASAQIQGAALFIYRLPTAFRRGIKSVGRLEFAVVCGLILSLFTADLAIFGKDCGTVRGDVVRLHILANSDGELDQRLKLAVRDRILTEVGCVFTEPQSQKDAKTLALQSLPAIEAAASAALREEGCGLPVSAQLCRMYFDTRQYGNLSLPAGYYDAVRVTIGSGSGHNWWCVSYPPLCIPAAKDEKQIDSPASAGPKGHAADGLSLSDGNPAKAFSEICDLNSEPLFKPKLALVEAFEWVADKLGGSSGLPDPPPVQ